MGGTVHGMVNVNMGHVDSNLWNQRAMFGTIATFFDHLSTPAGGNVMTRIASNNGNGASNYLGHPSSAEPCGSDHSWGVWKMNASTLRPGGGSAMGEVYILLGFFESTYPSAYGFKIGGATTTDGIGIAIAFREDGLSPWNGSTNDDGSDTSGTPTWTDGGVSTVHVVMPRSNNSGGSHATNRENLADIGDFFSASVDMYFHGFADDDNFCFFHTSQNSYTTEPRNFGMVAFGLGDLQSNCGSDPYCCYAFRDYQLPFQRGTTYGPSAGNDTNYDGGVKRPRSTVSGLQIITWCPSFNTDRTPNPYSSSGVKHDEAGGILYASNAWIGYTHEPGGDDFWRFVYELTNESIDVTNKRAAFGTVSLNETKMTVPWPDTIGEAPGATRTLDGVKF